MTARSTSSASAASSSRCWSSRPARTTWPSTRELVKGYIGPQLLADCKIRYLVDPLVVEGSVLGDRRERAEGKHAAHVVRGRDFMPDGEIGAVEIRDGDRCARCGSPLEIARGIELGHVFQLGTKYAETFGLTALDQNGKPVTVTMGSYGVGVTRAVAALAEQTYDEKGLCWPRGGRPGRRARRRHRQGRRRLRRGRGARRRARAAGVRVMYDDRRGVSPGVKFKDAELIGVPTIVIVGKGLADGDGRAEGPPHRRAAGRRRWPTRVARCVAAVRAPMATVAPYGAWESPISAERSPPAGTRSAVAGSSATRSGGSKRVRPSRAGTRSGAHGATASRTCCPRRGTPAPGCTSTAAVRGRRRPDGLVVFAEFTDQRLYRLDAPGGRARRR